MSSEIKPCDAEACTYWRTNDAAHRDTLASLRDAGDPGLAYLRRPQSTRDATDDATFIATGDAWDSVRK